MTELLQQLDNLLRPHVLDVHHRRDVARAYAELERLHALCIEVREAWYHDDDPEECRPLVEKLDALDT